MMPGPLEMIINVIYFSIIGIVRPTQNPRFRRLQILAFSFFTISIIFVVAGVLAFQWMSAGLLAVLLFIGSTACGMVAGIVGHHVESNRYK